MHTNGNVLRAISIYIDFKWLWNRIWPDLTQVVVKKWSKIESFNLNLNLPCNTCNQILLKELSSNGGWKKKSNYHKSYSICRISTYIFFKTNGYNFCCDSLYLFSSWFQGYLTDYVQSFMVGQQPQYIME